MKHHPVIHLRIPPSANNYKRHYCTRSTRDDVHIVSAARTDAANTFRDEAGWEAKQVGIRMEERGVPMAIDVTMYLCTPKEGKMVRNDADNILKVLLDSLNGIAWEDDNQVMDIHVRKVMGAPSPRIEVRVMRLEDMEGDKNG